MYRGGRGAGGSSRNRGGYSGRGGRGGRGGRQTTQQRGLFADGIWHCDCTPRLPAEHFKVKKEGPNTGRWFYTCQQHETQRCGFFLWDEDAKPREEAAVLGNSRTEPRREGVQEGWTTGRTRAETQQGKGLFSRNEAPVAEDDESTDSAPDSSSETMRAAPNGSKRTARDADLDEYNDWGLHQSDDEDVARAADSIAAQTPHKAQKTGVYATPATTGRRKLPWLEEPMTPATSRAPAESYFDTPSKQRLNIKLEEPETPAAPPTLATATTPSPPTRHKNALFNPNDSDSSLTSEVLSTLSTVNIPPETLSNLRTILTRHDLKTQGVVKGRDISRLALKAKDAKIVELQARIASLEADWEVEREVGRMRRRKADGSG